MLCECENSRRINFACAHPDFFFSPGELGADRVVIELGADRVAIELGADRVAIELGADRVAVELGADRVAVKVCLILKPAL